MNDDKITVDSPAARETFARWLARGDAVGVFVNQDLGHPGRGHRVFKPLTPDEACAANVGRMTLPDHQDYGTGWRYRLERYETSLDPFNFGDPA